MADNRTVTPFDFGATADPAWLRAVGYNAFRSGLPLSGCPPFDDGSWMEGWRSAERGEPFPTAASRGRHIESQTHSVVA